MRLPIAVFGDRQDEAVFLDHLHADQVVALGQVHGADSVRLTAHGAHLGFQEANRLPLVRTQEDVVVAGRDFGGDQLIAFVQRHRDDAARHGIIELGQLRFLDHAVPGHHHDELVGDEILDGKERLGGLVRLQAMRLEMCFPFPTVEASGISYAFSQ